MQKFLEKKSFYLSEMCKTVAIRAKKRLAAHSTSSYMKIWLRGAVEIYK